MHRIVVVYVLNSIQKYIFHSYHSEEWFQRLYLIFLSSYVFKIYDVNGIFHADYCHCLETSRVQSPNSLTSGLCHDINRGFEFSRNISLKALIFQRCKWLGPYLFIFYKGSTKCAYLPGLCALSSHCWTQFEVTQGIFSSVYSVFQSLQCPRDWHRILS